MQSDGIDIKMVGRGLGASGKGEVTYEIRRPHLIHFPVNTSRVNRNTPMCDVYSEDHVQYKTLGWGDIVGFQPGQKPCTQGTRSH